MMEWIKTLFSATDSENKDNIKPEVLSAKIQPKKHE
jgi:hypothetical protein